MILVSNSSFVNRCSTLPWQSLSLARAIGKTEAQQRRHNHIKRVDRITTVARRISQQRKYFHHAEKRIGPAMKQDDRQRLRPCATLVNEMHTEAVDIGAKLGELVELCFLLTPVILGLPVAYQFLKIRLIGTISPGGPMAAGQSGNLALDRAGLWTPIRA